MFCVDRPNLTVASKISIAQDVEYSDSIAKKQKLNFPSIVSQYLNYSPLPRSYHGNSNKNPVLVV